MNKILIVIFALITLTSTSAKADYSATSSNPYMGMNPQAMQRMAAETQTCMQNIDFAKLEKMKQQADNMMRKVKALCKNGKRDQAMQTGMAYGMKVKNDPELVKMRKCSSKMGNMMPNFLRFDPPSNKNKPTHICDEM